MSNPDTQAGSAQVAPRTIGGVRWQWIVLAVGMLIIAGTLIYMAISGGPGIAAPQARDIPLIENQVYTEAAVGEPVSVNPLLAVSQADRDLASLVYSGLTRIDEFGQPA